MREQREAETRRAAAVTREHDDGGRLDQNANAEDNNRNPIGGIGPNMTRRES